MNPATQPPSDGQISVHTLVIAEHAGNPPRLALVIDSWCSQTATDHDGLPRDAWVVDMMGRGWQQISHSPDSYPHLPGCTLVLNADATGMLLDTDRSLILPALPPLQDFWLDQARQSTTVDVIAGHMGLWGNPPEHRGELLNAAITAGQVIGARVTLLDQLLLRGVTPAPHRSAAHRN